MPRIRPFPTRVRLGSLLLGLGLFLLPAGLLAAEGEAPAPETPAPKTAETPARDEAVFVVPGEKTYHREGCAALKDKDVVQCPRRDAEKAGCKPCAKCFPPASAPQEKDKVPAKKASVQEIRTWIRELDAKEEVKRQAATERLVDAGETAAAEIQGYIHMYKPARRLVAIAVLEQMDLDRARECLANRAVFDKDAAVRKRAAQAVAKMGARPALRYLIVKSFSDSEKTQRAVARAFCNIQSKDYMDALVATAGIVVVHGLARVDPPRHSPDPTNPLGSGLQSGVHDLLPVKISKEEELRTDTIVKTLALATGKDFGYDMKAWATWWTENRAAFQFPNLED